MKQIARLAFVATSVVLIVVLLTWTSSLRQQVDSRTPVGKILRFLPLMPAVDALSAETLASIELPYPVTVERGHTLFDLFQEAGLDRDQANRATFAALRHMEPADLRAGTELAVYRATDDSLRRFVLPMSDGEVHVVSDAGDWLSDWREFRVETREEVISGRLETDLSTAMQEAGAPYQLSFALADVLQWDLDFNRDLRTGDEFAVAYRGIWVEGRFQRVDSVEAALYENRGRLLEAYRFGEGNDYYDGEGRPLRKQFLKSPLPFTRVTSRFSANRFHPVLKVNRPHYGVDYGAPTGTPVRATAHGSVTFRGRARGAGNMVKLRHPNGYETSYLHLSKFDRRACRGCRVRQGEVIGYVGATGLATAPHLDYRVKRGGRYMDPLKLKSEPAPGLSGDAVVAFRIQRDLLRSQLPPKALALLENTVHPSVGAESKEVVAP